MVRFRCWVLYLNVAIFVFSDLPCEGRLIGGGRG